MRMVPRTRSLRRVALALLVGLVATPSSAVTHRVLVARLTPSGAPASAAHGARLGEHLGAHPLVEVVASDALTEAPSLDSRARLVRRVAFEAKVDAVVVGRLETIEGRPPHESTLLVALRSGHSGGVLSTHRVELRGGAGDEADIARLAGLLLSDLGVGEQPERSEPAAGERAFFGLGGRDSNQPIEIESDELEFVALDDESRRLLFTHNVRVVQGGTLLTADRLEALYPSGASQPDRLVAEGNVHVSQNERRAQCDRAVYVREDERLTCEGRAQLLYRCDVVRGDSIQFDLGRDRAKVVGAATVLINPSAGAGETDCEEPMR